MLEYTKHTVCTVFSNMDVTWTLRNIYSYGAGKMTDPKQKPTNGFVVGFPDQPSGRRTIYPPDSRTIEGERGAAASAGLFRPRLCSTDVVWLLVGAGPRVKRGEQRGL